MPKKPSYCGQIFSRNGRYYIRWRFRDGTKQRSLIRGVGPERARARQVQVAVESLTYEGHNLVQAIAEVFGERAPGPRTCWSELWSQYERDTRAGRRASTRRTACHRAGHLMRVGWAARPMEEVAKAEVKDWVRERLAGGVAAGTVLNDLSLASRVFRWAQNEEELPEDLANPFLAARRWLVAERGVRRRERIALTLSEAAALLDEAAGAGHDFQRLVLAAITTGWRLGDLCALRWAGVDLEEGVVEVLSSLEEKTGKRKRAGLVPELRVDLERLWQESPALPSAPVFRREAGGHWSSCAIRARLRPCLDRLVAHRALAPQKAYGDMVGIKPFDFHSLRHTARSIMRDIGIDEHAINAVLGHASAGMPGRYTTVRPQEAREVAHRLGLALARARSTGTLTR